MKQFILIIVLSVLMLSSCLDGKEKFNKKLKDFIGEWQLIQMTYISETGEYIDVENLSSSIIFTDISDSQVDGNLTKRGTLYIAGDSISFTFDLDPYDNSIGFDVNRDLLIGKPIYSIGKWHHYEFELIDKKELVLTTDYELVFPTNEKLTNPVYIFKR